MERIQVSFLGSLRTWWKGLPPWLTRLRHMLSKHHRAPCLWAEGTDRLARVKGWSPGLLWKFFILQVEQLGTMQWSP